MERDTFDRIVEAARARQDKILKAKGNDYTIENQDRLFNFKFIAFLLKIEPEKVWGVYFLKHVLAILNQVTGGSESEPIEGRMDDVINYVYLLEGLIHDRKAEQATVRRASGGASPSTDEGERGGSVQAGD